MYYYAELNSVTKVCVFLHQIDEEYSGTDYIEITEAQYTSQSVLGMKWDYNTSTWVTPTVGELTEISTDDIQYKTANQWLSAKLDAMDTAIENAGGGGSITVDQSIVEDSTNAVAGGAVFDGLAGKSNTSHTHNQYATTSAMNTALSGKSDTNHTHDNYLESSDLSGYATTTAMNTALSGKSDTNHTHSNYATTATVNAKAPWSAVSVLTQAQYDAITTPVSTTLYLIKEA